MRRLADWIGGAISGVIAYRLWKRRQIPAAAPAAAVEPDDRAEELRAKLAETRASADPEAAEPTEPPAPEPTESSDSVEERRRQVHEEGRAAIDRMSDG